MASTTSWRRAASGWLVVARDTARDPMLWFLVLTAGLFGLLGQVTESLTLLVAMAPLLGMDAYLHRRTTASSAGLASRLASSARVLRDGQWQDIPSRELVPGDLVEVTPGDYFPADGLLVSGSGLQVDESTLTGESLPVAKRILEPAAPLACQRVRGALGHRGHTPADRYGLAAHRLHRQRDALWRDRSHGHRGQPRRDPAAEGHRRARGRAARCGGRHVRRPRGGQAVAWPRVDRCAPERGDAGRGRAARGVPGRLHVLPRRRGLPSGAQEGPGAARGGGGEHRPRHLHRARTRPERSPPARWCWPTGPRPTARTRPRCCRWPRSPRGRTAAIRSTRPCTRRRGRCRKRPGWPTSRSRKPGAARRSIWRLGRRRDDGLHQGRPGDRAGQLRVVRA